MIAWWGSLEARHHPTNCRKSASVNKRIEDDKGGWARPTLFPTTLNPERTHSSQRQNEPIRRNDRTNPFVGTTERTHSSERQNEPIRRNDRTNPFEGRTAWDRISPKSGNRSQNVIVQARLRLVSTGNPKRTIRSQKMTIDRIDHGIRIRLAIAVFRSILMGCRPIIVGGDPSSQDAFGVDPEVPVGQIADGPFEPVEIERDIDPGLNPEGIDEVDI
jgi:hypothetical protein